MTKRFWFHLILSCVLATAVLLLVWVAPDSRFRLHGSWGVATIGARLGVHIAVLGFFFVLARLLLRVTGSDRATGLLGLYTLALYVPFLAVATGSVVQPIVLLLVVGAVLEILDVDVAPTNAMRSGLYMSLACILVPSAALIAVALIPVVAVLAGWRTGLPVRYVLAASVPWVAVLALPGLASKAAPLGPLEDALSSFELHAAARSVAGRFSELRVSWDGGFLAAYAAFCFAGLLAATVRGMGPSRRGTGTAAWLLLVTTVASGILGSATGPLMSSIAYVFFIALANTGLATIAAMNPLHAGRRRMFPAGVFFMLPLVVGWVKLLV